MANKIEKQAARDKKLDEILIAVTELTQLVLKSLPETKKKKAKSE